MVVSEMMILANRLAADYALSHDVPIIYRSQDGPPEPLPVMTEYDPHIFDKSVRLLKRSRLTTQPLPHAGLGLDVYTQISSPIRRYTDMVMQRQIAAHLAGEPYPYEAEEIVEALGTADQVEVQNRRLERDATRYWIMTYIARTCIGQHFDGVAVDDGRGGILVEILPYTTRGRLAGTGNAQVKPGDRLGVTLLEVDAERGQMLLKPDAPADNPTVQ
jgi:exoribonuclease-2